MLVVLFISVAEDTESPFVGRLVTVCRIVVVVFKSVEECADLCKFTDNSFNGGYEKIQTMESRTTP